MRRKVADHCSNKTMVHAEEPLLTETIQAGNLHVSQHSLGLMKRAADSQIRQSSRSL